MEIKDIHNNLHFLQNNSDIIKKSLTSLVPIYLIENMISYQNDLNSKIYNNEIRLDEKIENLKTKQAHSFKTMCLNKHKNNNNSDPWLINYSNTVLPESVSEIIRLGDKFSTSFVSSENKHIFEIVKDLETNIHKIPEEKQDEIRYKVLFLSSKYANKSKQISDFDRLIAKNIKSTQGFLIDEKQLLPTKADKGNITVVLNKSDCNIKLNDLLKDQLTYEKIDSNPLTQLQKNVFKKLDNWRKKGYLSENIQRKVLITSNTLLARIYGLSKIHKDNYPLRPLVSCVNCPTYNMCRIFNNILNYSLPKPQSVIKKSLYLSKIR